MLKPTLTQQETIHWQSAVWDKVSRIVSPMGSNQGSTRGSHEGSRDGSPAKGTSHRNSRTSGGFLGAVIGGTPPTSPSPQGQGSPARPPRAPAHQRFPSIDAAPGRVVSKVAGPQKPGTPAVGVIGVSVEALEDAERRAQAMGERAGLADRRALEANKRALESDERAAKAEQKVAELQAALAENKIDRARGPPPGTGDGACQACAVQ